MSQLKETKLRRQVIVVTHNPNIVVHGGAELVLSLEAGGGQTRIACEGGLQETREVLGIRLERLDVVATPASLFMRNPSPAWSLTTH